MQDKVGILLFTWANSNQNRCKDKKKSCAFGINQLPKREGKNNLHLTSTLALTIKCKIKDCTKI